MPQQKNFQKPKRLKLRPSMREKKRYVVVKLKAFMNKKEAYSRISAALLESLGTLGYAKSSIKFIQFHEKSSKAIIRTTPKQLAHVKSALVLSGLPCIGVSGTVKRAREKFL